MMSFRWLQDEGMELCNNSGMKTAWRKGFWLVRLLPMTCYIMLYQQTCRLANSVCRPPCSRNKRFKSLANFGGFALHQPNSIFGKASDHRPLGGRNTSFVWTMFLLFGGGSLCLKLPYLVNHHFLDCHFEKHFLSTLFSQASSDFFANKNIFRLQRQNQVVGAAAATSCGATATDGGKKRKKGDGWGPYKVGPKNPVMRRFLAPLNSPSYPFICAICMGEKLHLFIWVITAFISSGGPSCMLMIW